MIVLEFKVKGNKTQYAAIDEAIRTGQFVRNKCIRYWMDNKGIGQKELYRHNTWLRAEYPFVKDLNSHACQASVERAYSSIARFYDKCKKKVPGKKGYPKFKKFSRSVEYKTSGWKLSSDTKSIDFLDKKGIGKLRLKGTWELWRYDQKLIKRVRLVRRADGYYVQFCIKVDEKESLEPSHTNIGLDVGLKEFYTDSKGGVEPNPRFYRKGEKRLKFYQRRVSRKKKGSSNRKKAVNKLGRTHLKISRQREEHAKRLARCVIHSNDVVAYEDLRVINLVKNHCLAKSINDAGWYQFRKWLEYFGQKFGRQTIAVNPAYTSQNCSSCCEVVKKSLSTRTHTCKCGCVLDSPKATLRERDHNAAINILKRALGTVGHTGTWIIDPNALGEDTSTSSDSGLKKQVTSLIKESPFF
ncbi:MULTISPECIES: transposase [unclassified Moorena]|uniref:RNA-guided endonuclease InsQ/TnpB family protein n=1 Tax=unclassified Moorena TaxID=2683338 RepID=UPI0013CCBAF1|nr:MULTISPECIES: transposase [unclassified Moorena]NEO19943.1 transposase [Moorena sp. SIO4A5]NEO44470.1 transposase [Moorena sp. SIO4A3]NEQ55945.1 transposase [Moorena sp. SIO4A1]